MKRTKSGYIIPKSDLPIPKASESGQRVQQRRAIEEEWLKEAADWKELLEEYGVSKKQ